MALTSRLPATFSSVSIRFSHIWCSIHAIAKGKNQTLESRDGWRSPDCSGGRPQCVREQLRACLCVV